MDDFNGLKIRMPGPVGAVPPAMASGDLDAVDWVGPYNDLAFSLQSHAKY